MAVSDEDTEAAARALLPILCPGYENVPGDVFDPTLEVFAFQREICLKVARAALEAVGYERKVRALEDIARGWSGNETYSGTTCSDIARSALKETNDGE